MKTIRVFCLTLIFLDCLALLGCWNLPKDFASMSLAEQLKAYEKRMQMGGARDRIAEVQISSHGYQAALAMVPYVRGEKTGIPLISAINIIWDVQARGCALQGSSPEAALRDFVAKNSSRDDAEALVARLALKAISKNSPSATQTEKIPADLCEQR